jgi:hypothetical protein
MTNFLSLPGELRNKIYAQVLVLEESIDPWSWSQKLALNPTLLCANKAISLEASSLLYAQNGFDFTKYEFERVAEFLDKIGRHNTKHIRRVYIDFPHIEDDATLDLEDHSNRVLAKIRSECVNLSTVITSLGSTNAMELKLDAFDSPKLVDKALALVDAQLRAILSLKEVIVEVYEDGPSADIRRKMEAYGWSMKTNGQPEEWYSDGSFGDYEYDYRYSDEYDSDFWRRADD